MPFRIILALLAGILTAPLQADEPSLGPVIEGYGPTYPVGDRDVLLDVLVDRPGDIASVSLRYKDLVYQRNGKLSGQLSLPAGPLQRGPAENAVVRSVLAHHFSAAAGHAADALGRNQGADALAILSNMRSQIVSLRQANSAFQNDPDLLRDEQILNSYITVLGSSGTHQPELADSLRYAAWAKAHRPPAEWKQ